MNEFDKKLKYLASLSSLTLLVSPALSYTLEFIYCLEVKLITNPYMLLVEFAHTNKYGFVIITKKSLDTSLSHEDSCFCFFLFELPSVALLVDTDVLKDLAEPCYVDVAILDIASWKDELGAVADADLISEKPEDVFCSYFSLPRKCFPKQLYEPTTSSCHLAPNV